MPWANYQKVRRTGYKNCLKIIVPYTPRPLTDAEYLITKVRLDNGVTALRDHWFSSNPVHQQWVGVYEQLACDLLNYEVEHNLLPL